MRVFSFFCRILSYSDVFYFSVRTQLRQMDSQRRKWQSCTSLCDRKDSRSSHALTPTDSTTQVHLLVLSQL